MRLEGVVRDLRGEPVPGVIVYAYQTDATGVYPPGNDARTPDGQLHGTLRGWLRTDDRGRYTIETIRPGAYPNDIEPQHIHIHVIEPGRCTYYIDDVVFDDDPRLTPAMRRRSTGRGGPGLTMPVKDAEGRWLVTRDISLGVGIPGYPPRP
jgi:protocatechuate 3,4-dioxygenase beta subunit